MNATGPTLWLAVAEDGEVRGEAPYSVNVPVGLERGEQLVALLEECRRVLRELGPDAVAVLDPEPVNRLTFAQTRERVMGEVLLAVAAAQLDIPCSYMSRRTLRSLLDLPARGRLSDAGASVLAPISPHWTNQRDLAALAALARSVEANDAPR